MAPRGLSGPATTIGPVTTTSPQSGYTARHLSVLEGLEAVRKRPGMYIGTTDSRGLMHCLWEIIDNSVDEALGGHGDRIEIVLHADSSVEVRDNARGIPVDIEPKTGLTGVEVVFTKLHAGGKFGGGSYGASGGLHGVGASVVNALSARLDVEVDRGGRTHRMTFHRGEPGIFDDRAGIGPDNPFEPFVSGSELAVGGKVARARTGTRVRYWADPQIFPKTAVFAYDELVTRARQTSFLVPGPHADGARRARHRGHARRRRPARGDVPAQRRRRRLRGPPGARHGRDRHVAPDRLGCVHRDGPGARRARPHDRAGGLADLRGRHRAAVGDRATRPRSAASSTSSRRPRAAPTWPASRPGCCAPCARRSTRTRGA